MMPTLVTCSACTFVCGLCVRLQVIDDNFDDPRLTDYETLMQNLADLRAGRTAQVRPGARLSRAAPKGIGAPSTSGTLAADDAGRWSMHAPHACML